MPDGTRFTVLLVPVPGERRAESESIARSLALPPAAEGAKPAVRPRPAEQAAAAAPAATRRRPWVSAGPISALPSIPASQLPDATLFVGPEGLSAYPDFTAPFQMQYPRRAFEEGRRGVVVVQLMIDENGRVVEALAVPGAAEDFTAAALAGLRAARFKPAQAGGRPVKARAYFAVSFVIE
jgi:TonB family protein